MKSALNSIFTRLLSLSLLCSLFSCAPVPVPQAEKIEVPAKITDSNVDKVELINLWGKQSSLSDFRGRYVVVNLWATWCMPCRIEMSTFNSLASLLDSEEHVVAAVAVADDLPAVQDFAKKLQLDFPVFNDSKGEISSQIKAEGVPVTFLLNPKGQIIPILDPNDGKLVQQVVGPRRWDAPEMVQFLLNLK